MGMIAFTDRHVDAQGELVHYQTFPPQNWTRLRERLGLKRLDSYVPVDLVPTKWAFTRGFEIEGAQVQGPQ